MNPLIPHLIILHSKELSERVSDEAKATGQSKSRTIRAAIDTGLPVVLGMGRNEILERAKNTKKLTKLPRAGVWLARPTEKIVADFARDLKIPKWKIYSLAVEIGMDAWAKFFDEKSPLLS